MSTTSLAIDQSVTEQNKPSSIADKLHELISLKSERDGVTFTPYQLAQAIDIKRSILHRLMHPDPAVRVTNPRIDTLSKIVEYFRRDGFNVSLDDFVVTSKTIEVSEQEATVFRNTITLPMYSIMNPIHHALGSITIKTTSNSQALAALELQEPMEPIFGKGSILIIDKASKPKDRNLVAVLTDANPAAQILRYRVKAGNVLLESIVDTEQKPMTLSGQHTIMGIVVQINAKT